MCYVELMEPAGQAELGFTLDGGDTGNTQTLRKYALLHITGEKRTLRKYALLRLMLTTLPGR